MPDDNFYDDNNEDSNDNFIPESDEHIVERFRKKQKSVATANTYLYAVEYYRQYRKAKTLRELLSEAPNRVEHYLSEWILQLASEGKPYATRNTYLWAVIRFYKTFRIRLDKEFITESLGEKTRANVDRAYHDHEIRRIVKSTHDNTRNVVIVLLLMSAGLRIGALVGMKLKDLVPIKKYKIYAITVYPNTVDEYITFCTPQCATYIRKYLEERQKAGEILTKDSPLIRNEFQHNSGKEDADDLIQEAEHLAQPTLRYIVQTLLVGAGLRKPTDKELDDDNPKPGTVSKRMQVMAAHGFRKYFNTQLVASGVNPLYVEFLMGHKPGLQKNYLRPPPMQMLEGTEEAKGYISAIKRLTIKLEGEESSSAKQEQ